MKYKITARDSWDRDHVERFGEFGSIHELSDAEVINIIMRFGRAEITEEKDIRVIEFQNGYD